MSIKHLPLDHCPFMNWQSAPKPFQLPEKRTKKAVSCLIFIFFIPKSICCQGAWEYPRSLYQSKGYDIYFVVLRPSGMISLDSCMFTKGQQSNCLLGRIPGTRCFQTGLRQCLRNLQLPRCLCYGQMIYGWSSPCPTPVLLLWHTYLPIYLYLHTYIYTHSVLSVYQSLCWSNKLIQSAVLPSPPACTSLSDFIQHLLVLQHESEMSVSGR